ncbi:unnamed protein product [Larinioides sclopetarius]|uniref:Uncharacterized protein n=1 Tax=Larinioides sclopetarius TaxID=280406 RepID=A0AAV2BSF6_9ARAC
MGILKLIHARKLKARIDEAFSSQINTTKPEECCSNSVQKPSLAASQTESSVDSLENSIPVIGRNSVFEVPYGKFPKSALKKLEKAERPTPAER